jgi:hypothetical protein
VRRIAAAALVVVLLGGLAADAEAQRRRSRAKKARPPAAAPAPAPAEVTPAAATRREGAGGKRVQVFDFGAMGIEGKLRTPQLLYFLRRAKEELDRASLQARSFVPELVRSIEEEGL